MAAYVHNAPTDHEPDMKYLLTSRMGPWPELAPALNVQSYHGSRAANIRHHIREWHVKSFHSALQLQVAQELRWHHWHHYYFIRP